MTDSPSARRKHCQQTENAGNQPKDRPARHPARAARCRSERQGCPLRRAGDTSPTSPCGAGSGTDAHQAAPGLARWVSAGDHPPPAPTITRGGFALPGCIPHTTPHRSRPGGGSHDATPMAAAGAPWPERAVGDSCHAGSVPRSGTASPAAGWPVPPAHRCEFPSIFSPVINNSSGIRHRLPEQRGRGATRHPKQTEPLSRQLCPSEPSSRTFKYTPGPRGD